MGWGEAPVSAAAVQMGTVQGCGLFREPEDLKVPESKARSAARYKFPLFLATPVCRGCSTGRELLAVPIAAPETAFASKHPS
jgi:hypothetical protein